MYGIADEKGKKYRNRKDHTKILFLGVLYGLLYYAHAPRKYIVNVFRTTAAGSKGRLGRNGGRDKKEGIGIRIGVESTA